MTTFADREHAIEAHYALIELAEFRDRLRRYTEAGLILAERQGLRDADATAFASALAQLCVSEPARGADLERLMVEIARQPVTALASAPRSTATDGTISMTDYAHQSWGEFVFSQLFLLFEVPPAEPTYPAVYPPST
jgi:hypothetical protein